MKKLSLITLALSLWLSANAFADSFIQINSDREYSLRECGGTIEATISESNYETDQINFVLRNVRNCSNVVVSDLNKSYKIPGQDGNRTGSYSIPASKLPSGINYVSVVVRSNSGAHLDKVSIPVRVVRFETLVGQTVYVPTKEAFAKVINVDYAGKYVLQFTTGSLSGLVGNNWNSTSLVQLSKASCGTICVGDVVIVPTKGFAFAQVAAIQKDGKYVLKFITTELAGRYGHNWTTDLLVY
ncbi:MAG: hypothetical protein M9962_07220 [Oligoflexia bacterium]|nr:hypothetical protein [Oligoflexia bacterium]